MTYITEPPFSGKYTDYFEEGVYLCRACKAPLYKSTSKFHSGCGWPSFDQEIQGTVEKVSDPDGERIEIRCANCHAHLGHIFEGEWCTKTNTRHCINSYALEFVKQHEYAYFGTGCFWCSEALFQRVKGVLNVTPGYSGGKVERPSYEKVCSGTSGHAEVVRIEFDTSVVSYAELLELFWASHDPTSLNRQGNDMGEQYRSIILYVNDEQKNDAERSKMTLERDAIYEKPIVTQIVPFNTFYEAEDEHKNYFEQHNNAPYCQSVISPKLLKIKKLYNDIVQIPIQFTNEGN